MLSVMIVARVILPMARDIAGRNCITVEIGDEKLMNFPLVGNSAGRL
jgi:hypothetical protein